MTVTVRLTAAEAAQATQFARDEKIKERLKGEMRVLKLTCQVAIAAGYTVSLCDGEEWTVKRSTDVSELVKASMSTDCDTLRIRDAAQGHVGDVAFIYGNSAGEVINDYHTSLEELLKPVNDYMDMLQARGE